MGSFGILHGMLTFFLFLALSFAFSSHAIQIKIVNNCSYTVWAAANPGGGKQLDHGQTWTLTNVTISGRIWGRTNCVFNPDGKGKCESGDCNGDLHCISNGRAPNTIAEYTLNHSSNGHDLVSVSVVEGFNIPIGFGKSAGLCSQESKCAADVNEACPMELRDPGGCNNPCTVFGNNQFCCPLDSDSNSENICEPTSYSKFFKEKCPDAATYPSENTKSICSSGTDYNVTFCPSSSIKQVISGTVFEIQNNCHYTVWAAAVPGGGRQLNHGEIWSITGNPGTTQARIWGRTNCSFNDAGQGSCQTGDCGGLLECQAFGQPPNTLAEYALNQYYNLDFFDISLVDGFNVPMEFSPTSWVCTRGISCTAEINEQCPTALKTPGGCNNPCTVFKTDEYCCNTGNCGPTNFSRFFKDRCPDAYSYPKDDETSTFTCPSGANYKVVFCA